jgi:hypothetical protein
MNRQKVWCPNWLEAAGVHAKAVHQDPLRHHLDRHGADGLDCMNIHLFNNHNVFTRIYLLLTHRFMIIPKPSS